MGLEIGNTAAGSGMTKSIYQEINSLLSPPLQQAVDDAEGDVKLAAQEALDKSREGWKKLSYSIAKGVVEHIIANMEIFGIQTRGDVDTDVSGNTNEALPPPHDHSHELVSASGEHHNVVFSQSNDGIGHIR